MTDEKPGDDLFHTHRKITTKRFAPVTEDNILTLAKRFGGSIQFEDGKPVLVWKRGSGYEQKAEVGYLVDEEGFTIERFPSRWEMWE